MNHRWPTMNQRRTSAEPAVAAGARFLNDGGMSSLQRAGLAGLVGFTVACALALVEGACSVDDVIFKQGPAQLEEDCAVAGDEDGNGLADCEDSICGALAQCAPPASCTDQRKNGDEIDVDCGGSCPACGPGRACVADRGCAAFGVCASQTCRAATSCRELLDHYPAARDGAYPIAPIVTAPSFSALCDMTRDGGGWTLLLKADGTNVLTYGATAWTDTTLLNESDLTLAPGNAKYQSFVSMPLTALRGELDGFRFSVQFAAVPSVRALFSGAPIEMTPYPTFNTGGANWSAQPNCRIYGVNLAYSNPVRFGWTANQEANCLSNDTGIGLGLNAYGAGYRCTSSECSAGMVDAPGNALLWGQ
jgi:hypothetical protein